MYDVVDEPIESAISILRCLEGYTALLFHRVLTAVMRDPQVSSRHAGYAPTHIRK